MNRRHLLGLLGLGGASGLGYLMTKTDGDGQMSSLSDVTGSEAAWQATMQSNLGSKPIQTEASFADESETVTLDESTTLDSIAVETTGTAADIFRFETTSGKIQTIVDVIRDSIGVSKDFRIEGSVDGTATTFEGSPADVGPYVAALTTIRDPATVLVVRADSRSTLEAYL